MIGWFVRLAFTQQRHVNRHVIGVAQCLFELDVFDPSPLLLDSARLAQVHHFLDSGDELVVVIRRIVTKNIHVESRAFLDHCQTDASGADDGNSFTGDFVAKERQKGMP